MEVILDIRSYDKYLMGHLDGALSMNYHELMYYPERYLNKNYHYSIYCDSGVRSKMLSNKLNQLGYSTSSLGGYNDLFRR